MPAKLTAKTRVVRAPKKSESQTGKTRKISSPWIHRKGCVGSKFMTMNKMMSILIHLSIEKEQGRIDWEGEGERETRNWEEHT